MSSNEESLSSQSSESISKRLLERAFANVDHSPGGANTFPSMFVPSVGRTPHVDHDASRLPQTSAGQSTSRIQSSAAEANMQADSPWSQTSTVAPQMFASRDTLPAPVLAAMARSESPSDLMDVRPGQIQSILEELRGRSEAIMRSQLGGQSAPSTPTNSHAAPPVAYQRKMTTGHSFVQRPMDIDAIRADFPALHQSINGHPLVWFDNAATTHKPLSVIEAMSRFYAMDYSNIHRAAHTLAARATDHYEGARETVRAFIHAESTKDIVFVRGTTEGINFIANTCKPFLRDGDEILLSEMEHHANIVPWQMIAKETRARIRVIPFDQNGEIMMDEYKRLLSPRTKIVSVTHASNTLGTILPVEEMAQLAHHRGARFVLDGAQSIAHLPVDVQSLGCDYFVFSGHKVFAPTGIGAVYVHPELHDMLPPWQGGGNMIHRVTFDETTYSEAPAKFEAGTPSIGDAVGLGCALDYLRQFDPGTLAAYEHSLLEHATRELETIPGVTTIGHAREKVGVVSFVLAGYTTEAVGKELDRFGIAVRTGHHCAQPSLRHFGLESTIRPSFALYNTHEEVDRFVDVIRKLARRR